MSRIPTSAEARRALSELAIYGPNDSVCELSRYITYLEAHQVRPDPPDHGRHIDGDALIIALIYREKYFNEEATRMRHCRSVSGEDRARAMYEATYAIHGWIRTVLDAQSRRK